MARRSTGKLERILARRLRQVAAEKQIPLSHVADRSGIARSHIWSILNGERSATLDLVQRLADALGVDALVLLQGEPVSSRRRKTAARSR